jgi:hypothetical protein
MSRALVKDLEILESLWGSTKPIDLLRFYNKAQDMADLIRFSKSRPRPLISLHKIRFTKSDRIVVVVPTSSINGKLAKDVANVFNPLPIVFVESAGRYFNYSRSVNAGVREALTIDPDWIIIANDDLVEVDSTKKLVEQINTNYDADCLLARPNIMGRPLIHTTPCGITRSIVPWDLVIASTDAVRHRELPPFSALIPYYLSKYGVRHRFRFPKDVEGFSSVKDSIKKERLYFFRKIRQGPYSFLKSCCRDFLNAGDFGVYSSSLLRKHTFDEIFICGYDDLDFSFLISRLNYDIRIIDFQIESVGGTSPLPTSRPLSSGFHELRQILNISYFFFKNKHELNGSCT